jgi:uncharacterized membrane protein HdeD (DUF308 family)
MIVVIGNWKTLAIQGAVAVLFGLTALVWPGLTVTALVLLFGAFVLVDGLFALAAAFSRTAEARANRTMLLLHGIISTAAGLVTFFWPGITTLALLYVIAAWAFISGVLRIFAAVKLRQVIEGELLLGLSGGLSILFAGLLVAFPGSGALAITWLIGWFALLYGVAVLMLAWRMHQLASALEPRAPRHGRPAAA